MLNTKILDRAAEVIKVFKEKNRKLATVESCTGGLITAYLTGVSGSSEVVDRGFTTYSNEAKNELVGVPMELINCYGAVSDEVARSMAEGGLKNSRADVTISVTGIAGPGGGSPEKPVGLVHFGYASHLKGTSSCHKIFGGNRTNVRESTVLKAFQLLELTIRD